MCLHWWGMLQLANARLRAHFFTAFKEAPRKLLITLDWGEAKRMPIWWQTGAAFLASMASHSGCLAPEGAVAGARLPPRKGVILRDFRQHPPFRRGEPVRSEER